MYIIPSFRSRIDQKVEKGESLFLSLSLSTWPPCLAPGWELHHGLPWVSVFRFGLNHPISLPASPGLLGLQKRPWANSYNRWIPLMNFSPNTIGSISLESPNTGWIHSGETWSKLTCWKTNVGAVRTLDPTRKTRNSEWLSEDYNPGGRSWGLNLQLRAKFIKLGSNVIPERKWTPHGPTQVAQQRWWNKTPRVSRAQKRNEILL